MEGDIRDRGLVLRVFAEEKFDAVVHLAARAGVRPSLAEPVLYEEVNCVGTLHLLEAAIAHGKPRFLFASSSSVYGINERLPFAEDDPVDRPISPYADDQARPASCRCSTPTTSTACRRCACASSPSTARGSDPEMAIAQLHPTPGSRPAIPFYGDGSSRRDYTYIDDIVDGVVAALDLAPGFEIVNLGGATARDAGRPGAAPREGHGEEPRAWTGAPTSRATCR